MAGTVTTTETTFTNLKQIVFTWTASAGGAADATTTNYYTGTISGYTVPGTGTAPSDNYDIRLLDANSIDVGNGLFLNRDQTNTEWVGDTNTGKVNASRLTLEVRNAGNAGEGTFIVYVAPVGMVTATTTESQIYATQPRLATATSSSPLTTGTLWTYTGSIEVLALVGRVTTVIQAQATTIKLSMTADALAAHDISSAALDINAFDVGSIITLNGTHTSQLDGSDGNPIGNGIAKTVTATCTTSGTLTVTYGAASTGAIAWYMLWRPLSSGATVS